MEKMNLGTNARNGKLQSHLKNWICKEHDTKLGAFQMSYTQKLITRLCNSSGTDISVVLEPKNCDNIEGTVSTMGVLIMVLHLTQGERLEKTRKEDIFLVPIRIL